MPAYLILTCLCVFGAMISVRSSDANHLPDPSEAFFDPKTVQTIHLQISAPDLQRMHAALPERITVTGKFRWNQTTLDQVGVRYKGNSSSDPNAGHKRSFLISFAEEIRGQRFLGLRHVALDNGVQFGSLFSEPLITEALRENGVKASRCNYARLWLNGDYLGIYVNVERIDRSFLERNFGDAQGILFKVDEGGPGADLTFLGPKPELYRTAFELHEGKSREGFAELLKFVRRLNHSPLPEPEWSDFFDLDAFVRATAILLFSGAFDQYTGWGPHNYYLYQNRADRRWTYLPWDLDVGFADHAFGRVPVLAGWNAAWPAPVPGRPLLEQIIQNEKLLQSYRTRASAILESHFRPDILIPKLRALYARIQTDLEKDPFPHRRATVPTDRAYPDILASMEAFIRERYTLARAQLDHPGERPSFVPVKPVPDGSGPTPGPPSADAPTDLRASRITPARVELTWIDHADGEVAFVVQKCHGPDATDFRNAIGQPGADITTAVDSEVKPGKTYRYRVYAVTPTPQGPRGTGVSNVLTVRVPKE